MDPLSADARSTSMRHDPRPSAVAVLAAEAVVAAIGEIEAAGAAAVDGAIDTNQFFPESMCELTLARLHPASAVPTTTLLSQQRLPVRGVRSRA
jgi:hypothetical protein